MIEQEITTEEEFVKNLKNAPRGDLAILKRACGSSISESSNAMGIFYRLLPYSGIKHWDEEIYFLVATLYGLNSYYFSGDFGKSLRLVKGKLGTESLDNRFIGLLDSTFENIRGSYEGGGEIAFKLRQLIKLSASKEVGIDWRRLIKDLKMWTHPKKFVQKNWAKSYFLTTKKTKPKKED